MIFFSISFTILLLASMGLRFLALRLEWVRTLSPERESVLAELIIAARWALSFAFYGGMIMGLSFIVRKEIFAPPAILCIAILTLGFTFGIDQLLKNYENIPSARTAVPPLGTPGLILSNSMRPSGTVIVLLEGPSKPGGKRVIATPGVPLLYQEEYSGRDLSLISLPPAPFSDDCPWFLKSLAIDLRLNAEILKQHLDEGLEPFLIYAGALVFFLGSLIFIMKMSVWPLANLFLGCIAFRGVLALEIFCNTREIQDIFNTFLEDRLPLSWALPLIFCAVGLLAYLYSFLVYLAKRQNSYGI